MLTVPEAARRAGRNPETIRRWIWSGRLPARKVGNQHVIDEADLGALIDGGERAGVVPQSHAHTAALSPEWRAWVAALAPLHDRLRKHGTRLPAGADLVRETRRGR